MKQETKCLSRIEAQNIDVIMPSFFIKSKTNDNELAKQYFLVIKSDTTEPALIIRKLVYTDNYELYTNFKLLKNYKGKGLFEQRFSIKISTLNLVVSIFYGLNKENFVTNSASSDQAEIVKQRLSYHFTKTDGTWDIPKDMLFMKEF